MQHLDGQRRFVLIFVKAGHCLFGSFPNIAPYDQYENKKPLHIDVRRMENIPTAKHTQNTKDTKTLFRQNV